MVYSPGYLKTPLFEAATAYDMAKWTLTGSNSIVKVVSTQQATMSAARGSLKGYITQARYLQNRNALQIERDLGLQPGSMNHGLYVFWFSRMPRFGEVVMRFTTEWPAGRPWTEQGFEDYMRARKALLSATTDVVDYYPPGRGLIPQWELLKPVPMSKSYRQVTASIPFEL